MSFLSGAIVAALFLFVRSDTPALAAPTVPLAHLTVASYAWNSVIGWTSMRGQVRNATNEAIGSYGVVIDCDTGAPCTGAANGLVTGYAWSPNYGWICWGKTCKDLYDADVAAAPTPADPTYQGQYGVNPPQEVLDDWAADTTGRTTARVEGLYNGGGATKVLDCDGGVEKDCYRVKGWAKVIALKDNGWVKLNGIGGGAEYGVTYNAKTRFLEGWTWSGGTDAATADQLGWFVFSGKSIAGAFSANGGGTCAPGSDCANNSYDPVNQTSRWATQVIERWLQTQGGNVYARDGLGPANPAPLLDSLGKFNASGLIQTDVTHAVPPEWRRKCATLQGNEGCGQNDQDPVGATQQLRQIGGSKSLDLPATGNTYTNALGTINKKAITDFTTAHTVGTDTYNAEGYKVKRIVDGVDLVNQLSSTNLGHTIFIYAPAVPTDLVIGDVASAMPHYISTGAPNNNASATVVAIGGNIIFRSSVLYDAPSLLTGSPLDVDRLPSVAWIALKKNAADITHGKIIIDSCILPKAGTIEPVTIAGLLFAEDSLSTGTGESKDCPNFAAQVPPIVDSIPLNIVGSIFAKTIKFYRNAIPANQGSEQIKQDGRTMVNPPPGLEDLVRQLPAWQNISP